VLNNCFSNKTIWHPCG